jgi:hypothetical protein
MKSAYELAMERLGGGRKYSEAQKRELAEIDNRFEAKKAETRIRADDAMKKAAQDPEKLGKLREELAVDLARLERKREDEKERVRARE